MPDFDESRVGAFNLSAADALHFPLRPQRLPQRSAPRTHGADPVSIELPHMQVLIWGRSYALAGSGIAAIIEKLQRS